MARTNEGIDAAMTNLNRLNEARDIIFELCGSDAHSFLKNLVNKSNGSQQQRSHLISNATSSCLDQSSRLSSDSIPDLVNTDFESNIQKAKDDNLGDKEKEKQQEEDKSAYMDVRGLETSSSFEKYSMIEETSATTPTNLTANEESNLTSESADRSFFGRSKTEKSLPLSI